MLLSNIKSKVKDFFQILCPSQNVQTLTLNFKGNHKNCRLDCEQPKIHCKFFMNFVKEKRNKIFRPDRLFGLYTISLDKE